MNILVVAHYQNDGSSTAIFIHDQMLAYQSLGHRVRAIVPIAVGKKGFLGKRIEFGISYETISGVGHFFVRHFSLSNYGKKRFNTATAIHTLQKNMETVLEGFAPDVIHAHTLGFDSTLGAWLKERLGVLLVVTTHGSDTTIPMNLGKHEQMRCLCDKADAIVAVSGVLRNRLLPCGTKTPIHVIHNGFRLQHLSSQMQKVPCTFQQTSHLIELKKPDVTIRAFAQIHAAHPEARLTVLGKGTMRRELEGLCRQLGVTESV